MPAAWSKSRPIVLIGVGAAILAGLLVVLLFAVFSRDSGPPAECTGSPGAKQSTACREALLRQDLDKASPRALDAVDDAQRIAIARDLCKQGEAISAADGSLQLQSEMYGPIAKRYQVDPAAVSAVARHLDRLCPTQARQVTGLPQTQGAPKVEYRIQGTGPVTVTYTDNVGAAAKEDGFAPWTLPLNLQKITDVRLEAAPRNLDVKDAVPASGLRCTIRVGSKVVADEKAESKGSGVKCHATSAQVVSAANASAKDGAG